MHTKAGDLLLFGASAVVLLGSLFSAGSLEQTRSAPPSVPQWQTAAGGKMKFDAASLKWNKTAGNSAYENIDLSGQAHYVPTGGLVSVRNEALFRHMEFAYKLLGNQFQLLLPQIPKWADGRRFDVEARAPINDPTKDQLRLMMQDLLQERFKLAVHWETRQLPVFGLAPAKAGKLGPQVRLHSEVPPCVYLPGSNRANAALQLPDGPADRVAGGFPAICGLLLGVQPCPPGHACWGARDFPIGSLGPLLLGYFDLGRPIVDNTSLTGTYDFYFDFVSGRSTTGASLDESGPTLLEAINQQLGLKLAPQTGPVEVLVIDHIEKPSPN